MRFTSKPTISHSPKADEQGKNKDDWLDFQYGSRWQSVYSYQNNNAQRRAVFGTDDYSYFYPDAVAREAFGSSYTIIQTSKGRSNPFVRLLKRCRRETNCYPFMQDCLVWQGNSINGYGRIRIDGSLKYVHRVMYARFCGPLEGNISHACGNSLCCNPDHLSPLWKHGGRTHHQENKTGREDKET